MPKHGNIAIDAIKALTSVGKRRGRIDQSSKQCHFGGNGLRALDFDLATKD